MSHFIFSLETLLRHRTHEERERQRDLAAAQAEFTELETSLRELNQTAQTSVDDLRNNRLVGVLDVKFLAAHRRYMLAMQRKSMSIAQEMTLARQAVDAARLKLLDAARQRKMLEKLREKQHERWAAEQNRREFNEADDVGMRLALADRADGGEERP